MTDATGLRAPVWGRTGCDNRPVLPRLEIVRRLRPVDLVSSARVTTAEGGRHPLPVLAPYAAATTTLASPTTPSHLALHLDGMRLGMSYDGASLALAITRGGDTREHRSRRMGRAESPTEVGLTLTGTHLTAWSREQGRWVARARRDLRDDLDVHVLHDEAALAGLAVDLPDRPSVAGGFGQLGLRDLRLVSEADGTPVRDDGDLWLSATSAGPGFFDSAHTSCGDSPRTPSSCSAPATCSSAAPTTPGCTATTPRTSSATATGGWSRPARGATSSSRPPGRTGPGRRGCG